jgi:hypothetical protein
LWEDYSKKSLPMHQLHFAMKIRPYHCFKK